MKHVRSVNLDISENGLVGNVTELEQILTHLLRRGVAFGEVTQVGVHGIGAFVCWWVCVAFVCSLISRVNWTGTGGCNVFPFVVRLRPFHQASRTVEDKWHFPLPTLSSFCISSEDRFPPWTNL